MGRKGSIKYYQDFNRGPCWWAVKDKQLKGFYTRAESGLTSDVTMKNEQANTKGIKKWADMHSLDTHRGDLWLTTATSPFPFCLKCLSIEKDRHCSSVLNDGLKDIVSAVCLQTIAFRSCKVTVLLSVPHLLDTVWYCQSFLGAHQWLSLMQIQDPIKVEGQKTMTELPDKEHHTPEEKQYGGEGGRMTHA